MTAPQHSRLSTIRAPLLNQARASTGHPSNRRRAGSTPPLPLPSPARLPATTAPHPSLPPPATRPASPAPPPPPLRSAGGPSSAPVHSPTDWPQWRVRGGASDPLHLRRAFKPRRRRAQPPAESLGAASKPPRPSARVHTRAQRTGGWARRCLPRLRAPAAGHVRLPAADRCTPARPAPSPPLCLPLPASPLESN
ncbi:hypothetical protein C2845_PM09G17580 [Panicum miliaceum]|uniref:Uncharacterized protein n=1 Tax=Panicum miliaceum TaxID=4540 RepID=A0A3L6S0G3_PANMI|nr:hypothetical protein C2845_PM09G17580 [Panicum miliaceum]